MLAILLIVVNKNLCPGGLSVLKIWAMIMWQNETTVQTQIMLQWASDLLC